MQNEPETALPETPPVPSAPERKRRSSGARLAPGEVRASRGTDGRVRIYMAADVAASLSAEGQRTAWYAFVPGPDGERPQLRLGPSSTGGGRVSLSAYGDDGDRTLTIPETSVPAAWPGPHGLVTLVEVPCGRVGARQLLVPLAAQVPRHVPRSRSTPAAPERAPAPALPTHEEVRAAVATLNAFWASGGDDVEVRADAEARRLRVTICTEF